MKIQNKKGFSLIELSIVLIIIGLLVAGITGGASLIKGAEIRSIITEANQYTVAVNTYYMSEGGLPGDNDKTDGNSNGRIEHLNSDSKLEGMTAWKNLSDKGLIDLSITTTGDDASKLKAGVTVPASKYKNSAWAFDFNVDTNSNVLFLTGNIAEPKTTVMTADANYDNYQAIKPAAIIASDAAKSVDVKMDDGKPKTGSVRGYNNEKGTADGTCIEGTDKDATYKPAAGANVCAMSINLSL